VILVDTALAQRQTEGRPVRVGILGAGFMARGLVNQIVNTTPGMEVVAIANRTQARAEDALRTAGVLDWEIVDDASGLNKAAARGVPAVTSNFEALTESDAIDCIIDATGAVEYGAHVAMSCIANGKHLVLMNAELDGTVGSLLKVKADAAGIIITGCDGDQPGVQMNLIRFVRQLGCTPVLSGNIKGLQDPYRNPTTQKGFAERWGQDPAMVTSFADGTKISFEQAIVANAAGFTVAKRGMLGWDHAGHIDELTTVYDVDQLTELGGVVDYVVGSKPGPGVYVMATHDDPKQRHYLELYKLGVGPLYSFYTPYHLCHFEVPTTAARAVLFNDATLAPLAGPRVEVITTAKTDLAKGRTLDGLGGYDTYGQAETASITRTEGLLPQGVAEGCVLLRDVRKDEVLTYADVELPEGRLIDQLRTEQSALFPS
jgi:predicted homoserine dehydrogenase-like protein